MSRVDRLFIRSFHGELTPVPNSGTVLVVAFEGHALLLRAKCVLFTYFEYT